MARPVDPKKRRVVRLLYFGIALALAAGIAFMLNKEMQKLEDGSITARELSKHIGQDPYHYVVIDVRTPSQFAMGHIPWSLNVPADQIGRRLGELEPVRERQLVIACTEDPRSCGDAIPLMRRAQFLSILWLEGGIPAWQAEGLPLTTSGASPLSPM